VSMDGTGMAPPPAAGSASGAVTSQEATRKRPTQGLRSGIKVDTNRHGIRRETTNAPKPPRKTGRKKV
jgi:hypothetical protein